MNLPRRRFLLACPFVTEFDRARASFRRMQLRFLRASLRANARLLVFPVLLLILAQACCAQNVPTLLASAASFRLNHDSLQMASLDGLWRFQTGDNPQWAAPNFDDLSWPLVRSDKSWPEQGLPVASGSFWYRARVSIPAGSGPLSLYIPSLHINYQVFIDGKLIGGQGSMPPHPRPTATVVGVLPVPGAASSQARTVVIAIRAWRFPVWSSVYRYGLEPGILIGDSRPIQKAALLNTLDHSWNSVSTIFLTLLEILAGLAALALFKVRSREREYLWFGVAMLSTAINDSISTYRIFRATDVLHFNLLGAFFEYAILFAFIGFYRNLMDSRRDWLYRTVIAFLCAAFVVNVAGFAPGIIDSPWLLDLWLPLVLLLTVPFYIWILVLLVRKTMEGRMDALLLLLSNAPGILDLYVPFMQYVAKPTFGWNVGAMDWYFHTTQWPFPASIDNISSFLLMLTMLGILIHRFTRTSLEEESHKRELEAARIVQQVLIPEAIPSIPGLTLDAVYKPAGQVGGDFFQILPTPDGGVLVVIGDVSGKGIPAAMTVSLLVGTVRTLAHYTQQPGAILSAMNHRMIGRNSGGFTTCLVLRVDPNGALTAANAGHLAPYLNEKELALENGLPLGLSVHAEYAEATVQLSPDARLTLLTDGVVEARNKSGELFGFDRTAAISHQPAQAIASTAQSFGQEDDITVLTVARVSSLELVPA